jgi:hypothetical protein
MVSRETRERVGLVHLEKHPGEATRQYGDQNDGTGQVACLNRLDDCSLDGQILPPGTVSEPVDVSATMRCPVYINRDATYPGCLIIRRPSQHGRQLTITANTSTDTTHKSCEPATD